MHDESCHQNSLFFMEHAGSVLQREIGVNACGIKVQRFITLLGVSRLRSKYCLSKMPPLRNKSNAVLWRCVQFHCHFLFQSDLD